MQVSLDTTLGYDVFFRVKLSGMLQLFQSNDMIELTRIFCARNQFTGRDPFVPSTIVVQSFGTGQWLKLQLANSQNISANLDCVLPADFVWRLYQKLLGQPAHSPMDRKLLSWRLMKLLSQLEEPVYEPLSSYLRGSGDKDLRRYQLSARIAGLFDEYLVYRPEWILSWQSGDDPIPDNPAPWQPALWRALMAQYPELESQHRASLHQRLLQSLDGQITSSSVPREVSLFGLSSMPVMQLQTFQALARHINVDIYFLNPCMHYWGDIVSRRDMAKKSIREIIGKSSPLGEQDYLNFGNPLLASMGKQGREYFELLLDLEEIDSFDAFNEGQANSALGYLQRDMLNMSFGGQYEGAAPANVIKLDPEDRSLQIHSCHSKLREVEILLDQILLMLKEKPDLGPADIIVMTPGIVEYAPFIHAIFKQRLPYGIADRSIKQLSAMVAGFQKLLELPGSRLTSVDVMDFLEVPAIARRFNLDEARLATLTHWVNAAAIRWEVDGQAKAGRWNLPANNQNTWRFGLDRLLLGIALDVVKGTFAGNLPLNVESSDVELVGQLHEIIDLLEAFRTRLDISRTAADWQTTLNDLLAVFFEPDDEEVYEYSMIQVAIQTFVDETASAAYEGEISPLLLRHWLNNKLLDVPASSGFISGGITFATLVPMRSIPFRVVCLLGMNDDQYPRQDQSVSFDLLSHESPRKGDRSRRADDRYLFLEAIISAEDTLYISYEGRSLKDNQIRPPSVVVAELLEYSAQVFDGIMVTDHPMQPFSRRYYTDSNLVSFQQHWFDALVSKPDETGFLDAPLATSDEHQLEDIHQLISFFRHTARYFLQQRLGIYFDDAEAELNDAESFTLDNLERYNLCELALTELMRQRSIERWKVEMVASGKVMDSVLGEVYLDRELAHAQLIYTALQPYLGASRSISGDLSLSGGLVHGKIEDVHEGVIVQYRPGKLHKRHLLEMWIKHLFANAVGDPVSTLSISRGKKAAELGGFSPVPSREATEKLQCLADLFQKGLATPLCFPPETAFRYFIALQKNGDGNAAMNEALSEWSGQEFSEDKNSYWIRTFNLSIQHQPELDSLSNLICKPILENWTDQA